MCGKYGKSQIYRCRPVLTLSDQGICVSLSGLCCVKGHSQALLEALSIFRKAARAVASSTGGTDPVSSLLVYQRPHRVADPAHTNVSRQRAFRSPPGAPATPLCSFSERHITQINAASSSSSSFTCPSGLREPARGGTVGSTPPSEGSEGSALPDQPSAPTSILELLAGCWRKAILL